MNAVIETSQMLEQDSFRIHPVILAGGSGTRLWPLSRSVYPKQLLALTSDRTLLQETVERTAHDVGFSAPILVCNDEHRFLIEEQLGEIGIQPRKIILEPVARNTGPALAAVALWLSQFEPDAMMLVQPADHAIGGIGEFHRAIQAGIGPAEQGRLVTFGIKPTRPEPGYGYIKVGPLLDGSDQVRVVDRFVEKPDPATATRYVESGAFCWNSGIFLLSARRYLEELRELHPTMLEACERAVAAGNDDLGFFRLDAGSFSAAPALSIDRAVMEQTDTATVVTVDMAWSDLGSFQALRDTGARDQDGNVIAGDVMAQDVRNSYLRTEDKLLAVIGMEDVVVVSTDDAVLVARADCVDDVSRIVQQLRQRNRPEPVSHTTTYRPWGYYRSVDIGERFQVKRLMVKPGAKLSLQKHFHRAEHWVVVHGTALVQRDEETLLLRENESVYIPIGAAHRLENPGKLPLHLIEVQSGSYLGEDDIVRLADTYGRC
ncbi:MAG TPA: mannose-1-phosphate guanylyltransferase/mannose-6-phosphate isomerase [Ferrovibrio sp.]|uniref:mannose-1-phosphate guanylyltransferase/mannose-6-phosphate isomerase n=1 Tax=Ferrovibrio sp. TaxID=1917215 RepID=UPI002ED110BE